MRYDIGSSGHVIAMARGHGSKSLHDPLSREENSEYKGILTLHGLEMCVSLFLLAITNFIKFHLNFRSTVTCLLSLPFYIRITKALRVFIAVQFLVYVAIRTSQVPSVIAIFTGTASWSQISCVPLESRLDVVHVALASTAIHQIH
jgi:hypothetical protein